MVFRPTLPRASVSGVSDGGSGSHFTRLLASSRLATHSPSVPQVYTAPAAHLRRGDFGVKYPLPSRNKPLGAIRYVDVEAVDTREGVTAWNEREHQVLIAKRFREMNVRLDRHYNSAVLSLDDEYYRGRLGPRISTTFDPSTRRSVPSAYERVSDESLRLHLQKEAREGRGPVYHDDIGAGQSRGRSFDHQGPFGDKALRYTQNVSIPLDYRQMDEKTFERFLEHVRRKSRDLRKLHSHHALINERKELVKRYNSERKALWDPKKSTREVDEASLPPVMTEASIPLPEVDEPTLASEENGERDVTADMWDESRAGTPISAIWRSWLEENESKRAVLAQDQQLPHATASPGGAVPNSPLHPQGGLQYAQPDKLQTQLFNTGFPARRIEPTETSKVFRASRQAGTNVAFGGHVAFLPAGQTGYSADSRMTDWSQRDPEQGVVLVKPTSANRSDGPLGASEHRPITPWGGKSLAEMSKSTSASSLLAIRAQDDTRRHNVVDALQGRSLPQQYGTIDITLHSNIDTNLARGGPGSRAWIAELDAKLGYRSGEREAAPLDITREVDLTDQLRRTSTRQPLMESARNASRAMFSSRELKQAERDQIRKRRQLNRSESLLDDKQ